MLIFNKETLELTKTYFHINVGTNRLYFDARQSRFIFSDNRKRLVVAPDTHGVGIKSLHSYSLHDTTLVEEAQPTFSSANISDLATTGPSLSTSTSLTTTVIDPASPDPVKSVEPFMEPLHTVPDENSYYTLTELEAG